MQEPQTFKITCDDVDGKELALHMILSSDAANNYDHSWLLERSENIFLILDDTSKKKGHKIDLTMVWFLSDLNRIGKIKLEPLVHTIAEKGTGKLSASN